MGWTEFQDRPDLTRAQMIERELSQAPTADNPRAWGFEYITERGSTVYAIGWSDAPDRPRLYFGLVCLTSRRGGYFAYKDMSEDMAPYYYDAPVKMLDLLDKLAPNPTGHAAEWRAKCREHQPRKKARQIWKAGDRIEYGREAYTLTREAGPRRGWIVTMDKSGLIYRIPARALSKARRLEPGEQAFKPAKEVNAADFIREHFTHVHIGD